MMTLNSTVRRSDSSLAGWIQLQIPAIRHHCSHFLNARSCDKICTVVCSYRLKIPPHTSLVDENLAGYDSRSDSLAIYPLHAQHLHAMCAEQKLWEYYYHHIASVPKLYVLVLYVPNNIRTGQLLVDFDSHFLRRH